MKFSCCDFQQFWAKQPILDFKEYKKLKEKSRHNLFDITIFCKCRSTYSVNSTVKFYFPHQQKANTFISPCVLSVSPTAVDVPRHRDCDQYLSLS